MLQKPSNTAIQICAWEKKEKDWALEEGTFFSSSGGGMFVKDMDAKYLEDYTRRRGGTDLSRKGKLHR